MKNFILLTFLAFCLTGCFHNGIENGREVKELIINPNNLEIVRLSDIFNTYEFIKLETKDKHFLGNIRKIKKANNKFFVLSSSSAIFIFSDEGSFIKEIYNKGKGPGEYIRLFDIFLDKDSKHLIVNDLNGRKLLTFDYNGNFINERITDLFIFSFWKTGSHYVYYCGNHPNDEVNSKLAFFDESNNLYLDFFPITENEAQYLYIIDKTNFLSLNDSSIFLYSQNDTIYNLTSDNISPRYYINFNGLNIPRSFYDRKFDDIFEFNESLKKLNYAGLIDNYYETENIILFTYIYKGDLRLVIVNKKTWKIHNINGFIDDMTNLNLFEEFTYKNIPIFVSEGEIYFRLESFDFINRFNSYRNNVQSESFDAENFMKLKDMANESEESDNPILIKFNLKSY